MFASGTQTTHSQRATSRTWGDKLVVFGLTLRGASILPQLAGMSHLLRFAGTGPMLAGVVVGAYEYGGWPLILGVPSTIAVVMFAGNVMDGRSKMKLRAQIIEEVQNECRDVPEGFIEALRTASLCHYETNSMRLEFQWRDESSNCVQWKVLATGTREHAYLQWCVSSIRVLRTAEHHADRQLPPQTRRWDCQSSQIQWELVWEAN
jgi:hypothetical protein